MEGPRGRAAQGPNGSGARAQVIGRDTGLQVETNARRERRTAREGTGAWIDGEARRERQAAREGADAGINGEDAQQRMSGATEKRRSA